MIGQVQIENGQKVVKPFSGNLPSGNPVGSLLYTYKKLQPKNYLYCDGRDTTGTTEELRLYFPSLYLYLGGTNVLPDYRECVAVGAEQNTTDSIATHDVYSQGQFKDDQMQKIEGAIISNNTYSGTNVSSGSFTGAFKNKSISGTQYYLSGRATGSGWYDIAFDSSLVTRTGTPNVTHGKQKAVYVYIKAVDGVDISDEDTFLNTVVDCIDTKISNAETYSLVETPTGGVWLDGKNIYRRMLTGSWDSGNTLNVPFSITSEGIERFVDVQLSVQDPYGVVFEYYYTSSDYLNCYYSTSNQQFVLRKGSAPANPLTYYLALKYTKTTD